MRLCVRSDRAKGSNYGTPGTSFGNQIAGTIPNSFTKLTKLHTWIMHRNMLTGEHLPTKCMACVRLHPPHFPSGRHASPVRVPSYALNLRVDSCTAGVSSLTHALRFTPDVDLASALPAR
jgi:hypothetical protein